MKYLKKFNESMLEVPKKYKNLIMDMGTKINVDDFIKSWNDDLMEDCPISYYDQDSNKFIMEDGDKMTIDNAFLQVDEYLSE